MNTHRREEQTRVSLLAQRNVLCCRNPKTDFKLALLRALAEFSVFI